MTFSMHTTCIDNSVRLGVKMDAEVADKGSHQHCWEHQGQHRVLGIDTVGRKQCFLGLTPDLL